MSEFSDEGQDAAPQSVPAADPPEAHETPGANPAQDAEGTQVDAPAEVPETDGETADVAPDDEPQESQVTQSPSEG